MIYVLILLYLFIGCVLSSFGNNSDYEYKIKYKTLVDILFIIIWFPFMIYDAIKTMVGKNERIY